MTSFNHSFAPFAGRMQAAGLPDVFIKLFASYYRQLLDGVTGLIPESDIVPVASLEDAENLPEGLIAAGHDAIAKTAMIKLNGGLGTSMGLERAKSLLEVKGDRSFLDITAAQAIEKDVPLILMNSFATHEDSLSRLRTHEKLLRDLPLAFVQHREPKVNQADLSPVDWPVDPDLEWCPPGHGDIYAALLTSGTLKALLDAGYVYAFVSNSDNLGAVVDARILGYFAENGFPFMMEVADRTEMDKKGGHLALSGDGRLILRELAQTPAEDVVAFQDIERHRYFNTNNLWLNLPALLRLLVSRDYMLGLPMIRNSKTVDPRDDRSPLVYHLETAMGSAISVFDGAHALRVPRTRFSPVKKTNDLVAVRSDAFVLTEDYRIVPNPARPFSQLLVELDDRYYRFASDLDMRFPYGVPSLVNCRQFRIVGDVRFGRQVTCQGDVLLLNQVDSPSSIPDYTTLSGEIRL